MKTFNVEITRREFMSLPVETRRRLIERGLIRSADELHDHRLGIFERLAAIGITQAWLAKRLDVSRAAVSKAIRDGFSESLYASVDRLLEEVQEEVEAIRLDFYPK